MSRQPASGAQISWAQPPAASCSLACDPPPPAAPASSCTSCARNARQSASVPLAARVQARGLPAGAGRRPKQGGWRETWDREPIPRRPGALQNPRAGCTAVPMTAAISISNDTRSGCLIPPPPGVRRVPDKGEFWRLQRVEFASKLLNPVEQTRGATTVPATCSRHMFPVQVPFRETGPPKSAALTPRHAPRAVWSCP
jgi:hypothetical protein